MTPSELRELADALRCTCSVVCLGCPPRKAAHALRLGADAMESLSSLLAIIHRDGGHYEGRHGTAKAFDDACKVVPTTVVAAEDANAARLVAEQMARDLEAELLRVRTVGHGAAHELDNIAVELGLGHSPQAGVVAAEVRKLKALAGDGATK